MELVAERKPTNIVDIATGTGDVAISMAKKIPTSQIVGIDLSEEMLKVAPTHCLPRFLSSLSPAR